MIVDDYSGKSFQAVGTELTTQEINVEYKVLNSSKYEDGKIIRTSPVLAAFRKKRYNYDLLQLRRII